MDDTWANRDFPVLVKVVELMDEATGEEVLLQHVASVLDMDIVDVGRAAVALNEEFIHLRKGGLPHTWSVTGVTPGARRATGQWPK